MYHQNRGFRTPSTEHLSPAGSDGSEHGKPNLVPPKLPSRPSSNSAPNSPASTSGPPLPKRSHPVAFAMTELPISTAPRLPPRGIGLSAPGYLEDIADESSTKRRVPPPPSQSLSPRPSFSSTNGSRESLTPTGNSPISPRGASADSFLPPPSRTIPVAHDGHSSSHHHHHHHFSHLPHQLSGLPITKILAAVKLGGNHSSSGSRSPQSHSNPNLETSPKDDSALTGTTGLLPPPTRSIMDRVASIRPHSSASRYDQDAGTSDEEEEGQHSAPGNGDLPSAKKSVVKVGDDLPDSSNSNRRPPILPEFQHPPPVYAAHHHPNRTVDGISGSEIRVPAHSGVVAVAGWWVVVASPGIITVTNMNVAERERAGCGGIEDTEREREMELAMGYAASSAGAGGAKGVWTIEMKDMAIEWKVEKPRVTAMEFRHGSLNATGSSKNPSRSSFSESKSAPVNAEKRKSTASDQGRYIWCGTRDGCLFELDVWNGGKMTDLRIGAHTGHVTGIFRLPGNRMLTLDEHGKCLIFCGVGVVRRGEEGSRSMQDTDDSGRCLGQANPRIHRIMHKEGFARVLNGRLWTSPSSGNSSASNPTAAGSGESLASTAIGSGGSFQSITQAKEKPPRHHHHRRNNSRLGSGPVVRMHEFNEDGAIVTTNAVTGYNIGPVTCGTVLLSTPGLVYLGHEGGWVTIWGQGEATEAKGLRPPIHRHDSASSLTSASSNSFSDDGKASTDEETLAGEHAVGNQDKDIGKDTRGGDSKAPVCLRKVKISISDVLSLEGVGSRLWAGTRKGLILAYDVTGGSITDDADERNSPPVNFEQRPWVVTNVWRAHRELPVARIVVDPYSVTKVSHFSWLSTISYPLIRRFRNLSFIVLVGTRCYAFGMASYPKTGSVSSSDLCWPIFNING